VLPVLAVLLALGGCRAEGPIDIDTSADACSRCRMSIDQARHAGEIVTASGEVRKYDSLGCLASDYREGRNGTGRDARGIYVIDYKTGKWIDARSAHYAFAGLATDHMGYGVAALEKREDAIAVAGGGADKVVSWDRFLAETR
jgi:copper chaperone NosL